MLYLIPLALFPIRNTLVTRECEPECILIISPFPHTGLHELNIVRHQVVAIFEAVLQDGVGIYLSNPFD